MLVIDCKPFAIVTGPGRAGSSLAVKLCEIAGYNIGKCNPPNKSGSQRHGYGEHPVTNTQGAAIEGAIDLVEEEGCNCLKLIHLHAQWAPRLKRRGYDVRLVVVSRNPEDGIKSGMQIYTEDNWNLDAIGPICGEFRRIQAETQRYLSSKQYKAYSLPFEKVVAKDQELLEGLVRFLREGIDDGGVLTMVDKMKCFINPNIVKHTKTRITEYDDREGS